MNKKKILNIILIPVKICLVLCMAYGIYTYFDEVFKVKDVDRAENFHSLPENSMDVIVLGSSHAQYSFIPSVFYQDTGLYSIVMGSACQPLEVSYQMLRETLKTQTPDMIILEAYTTMPLREVCEADVCYVKAQYMMTDDEKYTTIDYLPEDKALSYYNEFINNHNDWRNIKDIDQLIVDIVNDKANKELDGSMGYIEQDPVLPVENYWHANSYEETMDVELDDLDLISLNNIYELCEENGIKLLLYKTPVDNIDVENYSYLKEVWNWCDEKDVPYLDMIALQDKIDFRMFSHSDSYHCNIVGANAITSEISSFINDNYEFNHEPQTCLDDVYKNDAIGRDLRIYRSERNVYRSLQRINSQDLTLLVKYEPGTMMEERLKNVLIELGVNETFNEGQSYYAIMNNGEIIEDSFGDELTYEISDHNITINEDNVYIDGNQLNSEGNLSITVCRNDISEFYLKNININEYPWELGYDYFIKIN